MTERVKALAQEDSEKSLTVKTSGLEDVFAEEGINQQRKNGKGGKDLRGKVRVGHCGSVFAVENQVGVGTIDNLQQVDLHHGCPQG